MSKKKIAIDIFLNLVSTVLPTVLLQFIILPSMARVMSGEAYGFLVTVVALMNVIPATMGTVLNSIRLLSDNRYKETGFSGDFMLILMGMALVDIVIVAIMAVRYEGGIYVVSLVLTILLSVIWLLWEYLIVGFRLKIDYWSFLKSNLIKSFGYVVGYGLFCWTGRWQWVYIAGYAASMLYILGCVSLWKEPVCKTPLFAGTMRDVSCLMTSRMLQRLVNYADKLLIFAFLGGTSVSVYYAATVFGKAIALMIAPMNSVALTYLNKQKRKDDHVFYSAIGVCALLCVLGYVASVIISRPVLWWLYPQYAEEALKFVYITSGISVVQTMIVVADPFILKFFEIKWQMVLNAVTAMIYLAIVLGLLKLFGLMGFCLGVLIAQTIKFVIMLVIYHCAHTLQT